MGRPPLVDYILVAEFDIEKGSVVSFQYPSPPGTDVSILSELMLPDGAHKTEQDWTVFFLNQPISEAMRARKAKMPASKADPKKEEVKILEAYVYVFTESSQDWKMLGTDKHKVRLETEAITIVDTGKVIKRSPNVQFQQMEPLYDAIIDDDHALGLRFSEAQEEKTFLSFLEEFTKPPSAEAELTPASSDVVAVVEEEPAAPGPFLHCLNLVRTVHIPGVKRGARTKAIAICTQYEAVHVFKPLLLIALDKFFESPEIGIVKQLFDSISAVDLSACPVLSEDERRIIRSTSGPDAYSGVDRRFFATKVPFQGIDIPLKLPLTVHPDEVGDFSVIKLVQKFVGGAFKNENGIMIIFNALLRQQRIIFCGYNMPSGEVANYVLAASALLAPPLRGLTQRAFPYTNLVNLDNMLSYPGFIAGVTNPRFEEMEKWWDVLCNVATGQVKVATHLPPQAGLDAQISLDNDFIADIISSINAHHSEERVRTKFRDYAQDILDMAFDEAEFADEATRKKTVAANAKRIEQWRTTETYANYAKDREAWKERSLIREIDTARLVKRMRVSNTLSEQQVLAIYHDFDKHITTNEQLLEFLSLLPENHGGLYPIALPLLHPSEAIRKVAVGFLNRIQNINASGGFINSMNNFLRIAYERNKALLETSPAGKA